MRGGPRPGLIAHSAVLEETWESLAPSLRYLKGEDGNPRSGTFESYFEEMAAGDDVVLTVLRDGEEERIEVTLAEKKTGNGFLGVKTAERDGPGVEVVRVGEDDPASVAGIEVGDVILKFGEAEVNSREAFSFYLRQRGPGETIELTILRDGEEQTIEVELDEP